MCWHTHKPTQTHWCTHSDTLASTQTQICSCDNIRQHPPVILNDSKRRGDIWRWRACVCARLNVTEEIMCMCECYKCKPYYGWVSPRGVLWYAVGASSFMRTSIKTWVHVNEYSSMTQQGCVNSTTFEKKQKINKSTKNQWLTISLRIQSEARLNTISSISSSVGCFFQVIIQSGNKHIFCFNLSLWS